MDIKYEKLSNLVGSEITIESVQGFQWKMWDSVNNKMLVSDSWQKDYQKRYQVITDKGKIDMSQSQMANMLEGVCHAGVSDINNCTFSVKSNGKTGKEIRYWLTPIRTPKPEDTSEQGDDGFGGW